VGRIDSVLVTGGAGFIGSAVCRHLIRRGYRVVNVDKLTYAADLRSLAEIERSDRYSFHQADICDRPTMSLILGNERPDAIMHLAAETHVDRSIDGPSLFVQTNVLGTVTLLEAALEYWRSLEGEERKRFRFHHVSTDEVFGALPLDDGLFSEETPYAPSSPYSASKAAADHFVRAWAATYRLPIVLSNCSNNYGPFHFPEKLIPLTILNALEGRELPVYGDGQHVRDWLHVEDHAAALELVLTRGRLGQSYAIGGRSERNKLSVVQTVCDILDARVPLPGGRPRRTLIQLVPDRPGHDRRYAIDATKIERELGWSPTRSFEDGLTNTIDWFLVNEWWWRPIRQQRYGGQRLGVPE
jgi:dTDP-glucose 4,6-dehydratase